jgi:hypothetical protein
LGWVWASTLGPGWHDVAAWLVVVSSALIAAKDTVNWLTGVQDEFGEKAKTAPLGALSAVAETVVSVSSWSSSQRCDPCSHGRMGRPHGRIGRLGYRVLLGSLAPHNARICIITAGIGNQRKPAQNGGSARAYLAD